MVTKEDVQKVIDEDIAPALQSHGGGIELIDFEEPCTVKVSLQGACAGCPGAKMTLKMGVERMLRESLGEQIEVVAV